MKEMARFQFPLYCFALTFSGPAHSAAPFNAADAWSVLPQREAFRHAPLQDTTRVARDFGHSFRSLMNYYEDDHVMGHLLLTVLVVRKEVGTFLRWASDAAGGCE